MFEDAAAFNADISKWQTGQVQSMSQSTSTFLFHTVCSLNGVTDLFFDFFIHSVPIVVYVSGGG